VKILFDDYDGNRKRTQEHYDSGKAPSVFQKGQKYWTEIEITDSVDADCLIRMIYAPETIEGFEKLGFKISKLAFQRICNLDDTKRAIIDFIDKELEARLSLS